MLIFVGTHFNVFFQGNDTSAASSHVSLVVEARRVVLTPATNQSRRCATMIALTSWLDKKSHTLANTLGFGRQSKYFFTASNVSFLSASSHKMAVLTDAAGFFAQAGTVLGVVVNSLKTSLRACEGTLASCPGVTQVVGLIFGLICLSFIVIPGFAVAVGAAAGLSLAATPLVSLVTGLVGIYVGMIMQNVCQIYDEHGVFDWVVFFDRFFYAPFREQSDKMKRLFFGTEHQSGIFHSTPRDVGFSAIRKVSKDMRRKKYEWRDELNAIVEEWTDVNEIIRRSVEKILLKTAKTFRPQKKTKLFTKNACLGMQKVIEELDGRQTEVVVYGVLVDKRWNNMKPKWRMLPYGFEAEEAGVKPLHTVWKMPGDTVGVVDNTYCDLPAGTVVKVKEDGNRGRFIGVIGPTDGWTVLAKVNGKNITHTLDPNEPQSYSVICDNKGYCGDYSMKTNVSETLEENALESLPNDLVQWQWELQSEPSSSDLSSRVRRDLSSPRGSSVDSSPLSS
eukprot:TRINITY_DN16903_c0_g1_i1.p1 TRINITY_DN16903_c0_g1~~TRINITY_DN16903_c0_g1_i1.p1  ORF type:complete len:506 (-),score=51.30 TRINITY_DN16903_c0_g1_i1:154-1671(-)